MRFDPRALLLRHIVQPLYYARHRDARFHRLKELEEQQWLPPLALQRLQLERINLLLRHAYETTDFYRQRLAHCGIGAGPIETISQLSAMEPVTKSDLQQFGPSMVSSAYDVDALIKDASGGSTGAPTIFYKDPNRHNLRRADQYRHDRWAGWNIGDRWALIWGARKDLIDESNLRERLVERYLQRCVSLDAFELSDDRMQQFSDLLVKFTPKMILGYAGALDRFAAFIIENGRARSIRPSGIVASAECLTPTMRERIRSAFACPVLNRYGSREVGLIASECDRAEGLHINADNLLVEVVEDGRAARPGEAGDIVVTDFWNYGMPLIRYNLGDRAVATSDVCSCGRGLPLLKTIEGRASDFLVSADGTGIHGEFFTHLFYGNPDVLQFQFLQTSLDVVTIKVVPAGAGRPDLGEVVDKTRRILGGQATVAIEVCDHIPATPSGKYRFTISNVTADRVRHCEARE